jgi:hypothetical protein
MNSSASICPHCAKPIYDDEALVCLYCGESLNRGVGFMGTIKYSKPRIFIIIITIVVVVGFVVAMLK